MFDWYHNGSYLDVVHLYLNFQSDIHMYLLEKTLEYTVSYNLSNSMIHICKFKVHTPMLMSLSYVLLFGADLAAL